MKIWWAGCLLVLCVNIAEARHDGKPQCIVSGTWSTVDGLVLSQPCPGTYYLVDGYLMAVYKADNGGWFSAALPLPPDKPPVSIYWEVGDDFILVGDTWMDVSFLRIRET